MKRVAIYLRVSTTQQTVENQRRELEPAAEHHGWQVVAALAVEGIPQGERRAIERAFLAAAEPRARW